MMKPGGSTGAAQIAPGEPEPDFAPGRWIEIARRRLHAEPPRGHDDLEAPIERGDHDLNRDQPFDLFYEGPPRAAAVLVPLVARPEGVTVLLTLRCDHLSSHPGQVAFPGGKIEASDDGPLAAALREAEEEIGLPSDRVEPLGFLDLYQTGSGFRVVPAVALVQPDVTYRLDANEVAAVFEVPLAFLMTPANHQRHSRIWRGVTRRFYAMPYEDRYIWGATAGMIRNLYERVYR